MRVSTKKKETKRKTENKATSKRNQTIEEREKQIEAYLKINFEQMLTEKSILKERPPNFSIPDAVEKIGETFRQNMKSDRELYLRDLITRLSNTYQECVQIRDQYEEAKRGAGMSAIDISKENEKLQSEINELAEQYQKLQSEKAEREKKFKMQLGERKSTLTKISKSIDTLQSAQQDIAKEADALKSMMLKVRGGQKRMIKQVKTMILNQVEKAIDSNQQKEKELHDQKLMRLDAQIAAEKQEQKRLEKQCQMALEAIYSTIPSDMNVTRISVNELPSRVDDVKAIINQAIETRKESALKKLRDEVAEAIPGINISQGNILDVVNKNLEERLRQKEEECKRSIKKAEERERILKQKLDETLAQIREIEDGSTSHMEILDEVEKEKSIWEENRDKLDAKMNALSLGPQ